MEWKGGGACISPLWVRCSSTAAYISVRALPLSPPPSLQVMWSLASVCKSTRTARRQAAAEIITAARRTAPR